MRRSRAKGALALGLLLAWDLGCKEPTGATEDARVTVINRTTAGIARLAIYSCYDPSSMVHPDLLSGGVLAPGQSYSQTIGNGCHFVEGRVVGSGFFLITATTGKPGDRITVEFTSAGP